MLSFSFLLFLKFLPLSSSLIRFQTLLHYFKNYEVFNIDFMVACMQFINIVVHSVEDMNFRVHLQYEFTKIGLDEYLFKLRNTESERLLVQVSVFASFNFEAEKAEEVGGRGRGSSVNISPLVFPPDSSISRQRV